MFVRPTKNPIIRPNKKMDWQSRKVYNPTVLYEGGIYHLFFRAVGKNWLSSIGHAKSKDGENFIVYREPIIEPSLNSDKRGVEDPRVTKLNNKYYLTYTGYGGPGTAAQLHLAYSKNLKTWKKTGLALKNWSLSKAEGFVVANDPAQVSAAKNFKIGDLWSKAGGIFSQKINGKYYMLFGDRNIWLATSTNGIDWQPDYKPFITPRSDNFFDNKHIEMGPPPIKTKKGWLVLYHGVDQSITYRLGYMLLNLKNPRKIIKRSVRSIFEPRAIYELSGLIDILPGGMEKMSRSSQAKLDKILKKSDNNKAHPRVIFCCGACLIGSTLRIYYGAGDTYICMAAAKLADVLNTK